MRASAPPVTFATAELEIATIEPGEVWGRIYRRIFEDPLGFGKTPSRFSDPRRRAARNRFGVVYLGRTLNVCFLEAVLRDTRDAVIGEMLLGEGEFTSRRYAELEVIAQLGLLDLRGDARVRQGIPSEVVGGRSQALSRRWSLAFHEHPARVDGVIYPSRLNGADNIALYDRALPKVRPRAVFALDAAPGVAAVLEAYRIAIAPD